MPRPYIQVNLGADDTTPFSLQSIEMDHGDVSDVFQLRIWNDLGWLEDSSTAFNVVLLIAAREGAADFVTDDSPPLDEQWGRVRLTGWVKGTEADTTPEDLETGWVPLGGSASYLPLGNIYSDTARLVEFKLDVPVSAAAFVGRVKLFLKYDKTGYPTARNISAALGSVILADACDDTRRRVTLGGAIVPSVVPDDKVTVEERVFVVDGEELCSLPVELTLNQTASDGALAGGQLYWALISQPIAGGDAVATKGVKGSAPAVPALPADSLYLGEVQVAYGAGGSVIDAADIDQSRFARGEFAPVDGGGLTLNIGAGQGLSSTHMEQLSAIAGDVGLSASVTEFAWLLPSGAQVMSATKPEPGAQKIATVTTDGSGITTMTDLRTVASRAIDRYVMKLSMTDLMSTATDFPGAEILPFRAWLEKTVLELHDVDAAWSAGALVVDILTVAAGAPATGGTTIYTNDAGDDFKPTIAYDATVLRSVARFHEERVFDEGTRFRATLAATVTSGGGEANQTADVFLVFRRF